VGLTILGTVLLCLGAAFIVVSVASTVIVIASGSWDIELLGIMWAVIIYAVLGPGIAGLGVVLMRAAIRLRMSVNSRTQPPPAPTVT